MAGGRSGGCAIPGADQASQFRAGPVAPCGRLGVGDPPARLYRSDADDRARGGEQLWPVRIGCQTPHQGGVDDPEPRQDGLQGAALAGLPATAMAYLGEEMSPRALAGAMGLYNAGNSLAE